MNSSRVEKKKTIDGLCVKFILVEMKNEMCIPEDVQVQYRTIKILILHLININYYFYYFIFIIIIII